MIDLNLNNIVKYYGANKVFDDITFEIQAGEKIGFIGRNGTGKTTVFKILAGLEKHDEGDVFKRKGATVGYLDQIPAYPIDYRVIDVLMSAFDEALAIKEQMRLLEEQMSDPERPDYENLLTKYGKLQEAYEIAGGYEIDERLSRLTVGFKLDQQFLETAFKQLSGGEKTKVVLGKMLLEEPDIMLLDEPTNHLDLESIEWLEEYLKNYKGSSIIISHDRYFLDHTVSKIVEIERGKTKTYTGNYSKFIVKKEEDLKIQMEAYKNQTKKIKEMEEAISRFNDWGTRADNEAMFVKARNMQKRIDKMDKIDKPFEDNRNINLAFNGAERSGKEVVTLKNIRMGFEERTLFEDLNLTLRFQDKVVLLGNNGVGKTTLFNIIRGLREPLAGEVKIGSRVKIGILEQEIFFEDEQLSILEHFKNVTLEDEGYARRKLARFMFYQEDVFKSLASLSGGEKVRLKLCLLMEEDINLLILDEPTNHIDIKSREILELAVGSFNGTVLFISHDRYFIDKIANKVFEIKDKKLGIYDGDYSYYKEEIEKKREAETATLIGEARLKKTGKGRVLSEEKVKEKNRKKLEKQAEGLEGKANKLEADIEQINEEMIRFASEYEKLDAMNMMLREKKSELEVCTDQLLETLEALETL